VTLRTLGGLSTAEIARAFLVKEATVRLRHLRIVEAKSSELALSMRVAQEAAQRLARTKQKIARAHIPYEIPDRESLAPRLAAVLSVLYLVFNEGYLATSHCQLVRRDLVADALRLARGLSTLLPHEPEPMGLLALMVLHDSRREARVSDEGELVLLEDQDRTKWKRAQIEEGVQLVEAGSLKKERITKQIYKTRDLAREEVADYIDRFYNRTRRHSHGMPPRKESAAVHGVVSLTLRSASA